MTRKLRILASAVRNLWVLACVSDGLDPNSGFVVFSKDNPFADRLNDATIRLHAERYRQRPKAERAVCDALADAALWTPGQ